MKSVLIEFNEMLLTWNVSIDLPENLPTKFAYHLSILRLDVKTDIVNEGMVHFDFCTGNAPECELKEYFLV